MKIRVLAFCLTGATLLGHTWGCAQGPVANRKVATSDQERGLDQGDSHDEDDNSTSRAPDEEASLPAGAGDDEAQTIKTAREFLGYHYWWGGGRLIKGDPDKGWCKGNCPNCTRGGSSGADCSGLVAKAWRLPPAMPLEKNAHPYSTATFVQKDHKYWKSVSMQDMKVGDAPVYNTNGRGHIVIVSEVTGTNWGQPKVIEAKGCKWGIVENVKKLESQYQNRRKK